MVHVYGSLLPGAGQTPAVGPIVGSTTKGPILQAAKDPDTCNGRTMSSAPNYGARADWDGVSYHLRQRKYVSGSRRDCTKEKKGRKRNAVDSFMA